MIVKTGNIETRGQVPVWISAILACAGRGDAAGTLQHHVRWKSGRPSLRFTNNGFATALLPALELALAPGARADIRWAAGSTSYEVRIKPAASVCPA